MSPQGKLDGAGFDKAREVFTALMGILGTIVGFYYGAAERAGGKISLGEILLLPGEKATDKHLITHVSGGTPPYKYTVTFALEVEKEKPPLSGETKDGLIQISLSLSPNEKGTITVEVNDTKNAQVSASLKIQSQP